MARLPRIVIPNQPLHVMHRGNNRQDIFESDEDMVRIKEDIAHALAKSGCQLHAYVIMTNHLHLLITPKDKSQLAVFMQAMANRYVRYFNAKHGRTGTIWEGRFKSCLVDSEYYLFALYKYIEMNPIKANMAAELADYKWSSYHHNALGVVDKLITEHVLYIELAEDAEQRCSHYQDLFDALDMGKQDDEISKAALAGDVYGSQDFHTQIGKLISRVTRKASHGGDRKSEGYKKKSG